MLQPYRPLPLPQAAGVQLGSHRCLHGRWLTLRQSLSTVGQTLDADINTSTQVLAVGYQTATAVKQYCLNRVGDLYQARLGEPGCSDSLLPYPQGFPNYYTPLDSALQVGIGGSRVARHLIGALLLYTNEFTQVKIGECLM